MKNSLLSIGIAGLAVCCHVIAQPPSKTSPPRILSPGNVADQPHHLDVNAEQRVSGSYQFTVIIRAKDAKLPKEFGSGYLTIQDGDKFVCGCQVKAVSEDSTVRFAFDVAPAYLAKSRFSLLIYTANAEERKKLSSAGGWVSYEFTLNDFVAVEELD